MAQLDPCDREVFYRGIPVLWATTFEKGAEVFDRWVKFIAAMSGQKVDWHYSGGRAQVLVIGDCNAVREAVEENPWAEGYHLFKAGEGLYRNFGTS